MLLIINVIIVNNVYKHLNFYYRIYIFYLKNNDYFRLSKPSEFWKLCVGGDKSEFLKYQNYVKEHISWNVFPRILVWLNILEKEKKTFHIFSLS